MWHPFRVGTHCFAHASVRSIALRFGILMLVDAGAVVAGVLLSPEPDDGYGAGPAPVCAGGVEVAAGG